MSVSSIVQKQTEALNQGQKSVQEARSYLLETLKLTYKTVFKEQQPEDLEDATNMLEAHFKARQTAKTGKFGGRVIEQLDAFLVVADAKEKAAEARSTARKAACVKGSKVAGVLATVAGTGYAVTTGLAGKAFTALKGPAIVGGLKHFAMNTVPYLVGSVPYVAKETFNTAIGLMNAQAGMEYFVPESMGSYVQGIPMGPVATGVIGGITALTAGVLLARGVRAVKGHFQAKKDAAQEAEAAKAQEARDAEVAQKKADAYPILVDLKANAGKMNAQRKAQRIKKVKRDAGLLIDQMRVEEVAAQAATKATSGWSVRRNDLGHVVSITKENTSFSAVIYRGEPQVFDQAAILAALKKPKGALKELVKPVLAVKAAQVKAAQARAQAKAKVEDQRAAAGATLREIAQRLRAEKQEEKERSEDPELLILERVSDADSETSGSASDSD